MHSTALTSDRYFFICTPGFKCLFLKIDVLLGRDHVRPPAACSCFAKIVDLSASAEVATESGVRNSKTLQAVVQLFRVFSLIKGNAPKLSWPFSIGPIVSTPFQNRIRAL
jgi:hypothetical protein